MQTQLNLGLSRVIAGLAILIGLSEFSNAQEKGDRVVVVAKDARLESPGRTPQAVEPGTTLVVRSVRGSWLRIEDQGGWVAKSAVIPLAEAEAYFDGRIADAKAEFSDFHALAQLRGDKLGWQEAVQVYDRALKTFPESAMAYSERAMAHSKMGKIKEAIADYEKAIELDGNMIAAMNNLAWIRATGDADHRDGEKALALATKARELTRDQDPAILDTYAAANAEVGKFQDAMKWQIAAIRLKERGAEADALYQRLKLYSAKQAFRAKSQ